MYLRAGLPRWVVKNPPAKCRRHKRYSFIPGSGRSPGQGHSNPLQSSCLENPMDRGAWWATLHGVTKCQTHLKRLSTHTYLKARCRYDVPLPPKSSLYVS